MRKTEKIKVNKGVGVMGLVGIATPLLGIIFIVQLVDRRSGPV